MGGVRKSHAEGRDIGQSEGVPRMQSVIPRWLSGKESTCQCRAQGSNPMVGKMPWRRKWQPTSVFLPGIFHGEESGGLQSMGSQSIRHNLATEHACMPLAIRVTVKYSGCFSIGGPSWFPWRQLKAWAFLRMGLKQPLLLSWKGIVAAAAAAS